MELAFDEAQHQTGLPHRRFSQQHQFELADLVAGCRAVSPRRSASPCHGPVLKMCVGGWGESRSEGENAGGGLLGPRGRSGVQAQRRQMTERVRTSPDGAAEAKVPVNVS